MKSRLPARLICLLFCICMGWPPAKAQQTAEKFVYEMRYLLSLPDGYEQDTAKRWPLLIFLHGSGEAGTDINKVKVHGPPELADKGKKLPFIVISPQAEPNAGWEIENLYKLIQNIKKTRRVDADRVYLTGLSMGGYGSWTLAMRYPGEFAAVAPVCGGGDTSTAWKLRHMAVWAFHGAKDDVVLSQQSIDMVNAVKRYNPSARLTIYPEAKHNSWDSTYNTNDNLYTWLLQQKRFSYKEIKLDSVILKQYVGKYASPGQDTVVIKWENSQLTAYAGHDIVILRPASADLFFIMPDDILDIKFTRNKTKVSGFEFRGGNKVFYRKL